MINIKDIYGNILLSTEIGEGSKKKYTLQKEDYITLKFSLKDPIAFQLGSYVDDSSIGLYELVDLYNPTYNTSTGGYDYELRLDAYYWKWKNKVFKYTPEQGGQEASWNLTASLDVHLGIFLRNLKALKYSFRGTDFSFSIDNSVSTSSKLVSYDNTNMIDALTKMAETWECEWWIENSVINFGRCEYGTAVNFEVGKNIVEMTSSGNRSTYATRVYAFGSTRNIPYNYRPIDETIVANGVVQKRLMLPEGTPYIDAYPGLPTVQAVEQVVVFDDVYPKTKGVISEVSTYDKTSENEDSSEEGEESDNENNSSGDEVGEGDTGTTETFYRFKDSNFNFSQEYILEGEELHIIFQSGLLNGMDFGVMFNPNAAPEKLDDGSWNPEAQLWEIVANEDYGRKLPDDVLKPSVGDTYVLYGWDSTKIEGLGLVAEAENELKQRTEAYIKKTKIDPNTYSCKMMSDYMYGLDEEGNQNPNFAKHFDIGDKVRLINKAYFESGRRESRIIGYEYNLDKPYDNPILVVGETAAYSRIGALENKLDNITLRGQTYTGGGGTGGSGSIYVIGTNDVTAPSNRNVYSALKALQSFINKTRDDRSVGIIASNKGFEVGKFVSGATGGIFSNDKQTGQSNIEVDKLYVRMKAYFETLEIVNVNSIGGKQVISPAGAVRLTMAYKEGEKYKVVVGINEEGVKVEEERTVPEGVYRCFFLAEQDGQEVENRYKKDDQVQSKDFNIKKPGQYNQVTNHYYWRLVTGVSVDPVTIGLLGYHYVDLSITDCDTGSDAPAEGDVIAHLGNRNDVDRQNALVFSSVDIFSPSITLYQGINSYSYLNKDVVSYGVDKTTGKAFFNVYGDMYIGDRNNNSFLKFTQEYGLELKGKLDVNSTLSTGLTLTDALKKATEDAVNTAKEDIGKFNDALQKDIENLQNQVDGSIETFYLNGAPTNNNAPWNEWIAIDEANGNIDEQTRHVGDLYFDKDTGFSYRFQKIDGGGFEWNLVKDTEVTKALAAAAKAQDTADGKRKVFVEQPTDADEYEVGDLWVNATYPTDGSTYKDDILRSVSKKSSGSPFSINQWTKSSKYTDDTKAEEVQKNVDKLSTNINNVSNTVNSMKDFTDTAFADGIVDRSEASAITNYLKVIETTQKDVINAYSSVYNNALLDGVDKTNLGTAYTGFNTAATELINAVNDAIRDGKTDSIERANVDAKYTNFNTKYGEFVAYLNAANKYIQDKINKNANDALTQIGGLAYLKKALKENTNIEGGLIQSSMLALGYTPTGGNFTVMSGTNGIYDSSKRGGGIASWWGGGMLDMEDYTSANMPSNVANGLVRFDGSGYLAGGNIKWDASGKVTADPLSFFVGPSSVALLLSSFQVVPLGNNSHTPDYIIPHVPFQSITTSTGIRIGNGWLKWDETNKAVYVEAEDGSTVGFYSKGWLSAMGAAPSSGSGSTGGASALRELSDVVITSPATGQTLVYDGSKWVNQTIQSGSGTAGLDEEAMWTALGGNDASRKIHSSHIPDLSGNYVTLASAQTISGAKTFSNAPTIATGSFCALTIKRNDASNGASIAFRGSDSVYGYIGMNAASKDKGLLRWNIAADTTYTILDTGNYSSYITGFVKKSGDTMTGQLIVKGAESRFTALGLTYTDVEIDVSYAIKATGKIGSTDYMKATRFISSIATGTAPLTVNSNTKVTNLNADMVDGVHNGNLTASWLNPKSGLSYGASGLQYFNLDGKAGTTPNTNVTPENGWHHIIRMNHENNGGYLLDIAAPLNTVSGLWWRQVRNGTNFGWYKVLDTNNYATTLNNAYVKKSGDTMSGALTISNNAYNKMLVLESTGTSGKNQGAGIWFRAATDRAQEIILRHEWYDVFQTGYGLAISRFDSIEAGDANMFLYNTGRYISKAPTGTAPYQCASTTVNTNLNADLLDGWHRNYFPCNWNKSRSYSFQFAMGNTDNSWKKIFACSEGGTSSYRSTTVWGQIWYANGNHYQSEVKRFNFCAIFYFRSGPTETGGPGNVENRATLFLPTFAKSMDIIRIVRVAQNSFELQVRQRSSYNMGFIQYQYGNYSNSDNVTAWEGIQSTTNSTVAVSAANATTLSDSIAGMADSLTTSRTIWGQSFNGSANVSGDMTGVGSITMSGNLTLKGSSNYGNKINFGDGDYVYLHEASDDVLTIYGSGGIKLNTNGSSSISVNTGITATGAITTSGGRSSLPTLSCGYVNTIYALSTASFICNSWVRTTGNTGWYNETYGGGWYMNDSTWIRNYNNKPLYMNTAIIRTDSTADSASNSASISTAGTVYAAKNVYAAGAVTAKASSSDIRLKTDITQYNALEIIRKFRSVKYHWNEIAKANSQVFNNNEWHFGLIAQDLLQGGYKQWVKDVFKDYYTIEYERIIPVLWKGIQETDSEVDILKKRVSQLEQEVKRLKSVA